MHSVSELLGDLFLQLDRAQVAYCALSGYEELPYRTGNDLDIWVSPKDLPAFEQTLLRVAESLEWHVLKPNVSPRLSRGEGKYYLVRSGSPPQIVHLDCWTYLYWRGVPYVDSSQIGCHVERDKRGLSVAEGSLGSIISALGDVLHGRPISQKHREAIARYSDQARFLDVLVESFGGRVGAWILNMLHDNQWDDLVSKARYLRRVLLTRALLRRPGLQIRCWGAYLYGAFRNRLIKNFGAFVVFIGPDGSGKTTAARGLLNSAAAEKLFARRFYFHTTFPFLPKLRRIALSLGIARPVETEEAGPPSKRLQPLPLLRSMLYPVYYGVNNFLGRFWLWKQMKNGGALVVLDRYFYEYLIDPQFSRCPRWLLSLLLRLIPKPDALIYLKADPQTVYRRKGELPLAEVQALARKCEQVLACCNNGFAVEADTPVDDTLARVWEIVVGVLVRKNAVGSCPLLSSATGSGSS